MRVTPSHRPSQAPSGIARIVFRVVGTLLVAGGGTSAYVGVRRLGALGDFDSPGFAELGPLVIGMFAVILGLGALNAGFLGWQARYVAGETAGAVRTTSSAWHHGRSDAHDSFMSGASGSGSTSVSSD